ncbi:MAG TPA: cyanophycin synthetase, partial [Clostridia bacterium]
NNRASWTAKNIRFNSLGCASFDVYNNDSFYSDISLSVPGIHNVSNSLAAIASCSIMGCAKETIKSGILRFTGTHRRFETKGIADGIRVVDDYAHHPSEVQATLNAAKNAGHNRIWSVFQPHTYTRTKFLMDEFAGSFNAADRVIITDIYAAREKDTGEVHAKMLCDRLKKNKEDSLYISGFDNIVDYLVENVEAGDLVITLGAGDVYRVGEMFLEKKSKG